MEVVSKYVALADRGPVLVNHGKPASVPAPPVEDLITTVRDLARMPTETSTSVTQSLANGYLRIRKVTREQNFPYWPHPAPPRNMSNRHAVGAGASRTPTAGGHLRGAHTTPGHTANERPAKVARR
uniref:Uncharacterized protein n=1 Tax=Tetraselmis chuii TaxID=63592 RepID=A0A7S1T7K4_9CHLO